MKLQRTALAMAALAGATFTGATPAASQDVMMGTVEQFGFNFCPRGWMATQGQLLPISQYNALFSLLGTTYGGDGRTTFALPDTQGRMMIGTGTGSGLPTYSWGQRGGSHAVTLTVANMPVHNHPATLRAEDAAGTSDNPTNHLMADFPDGQGIYADGPANVNMAADAIQIGNAGGSQSFDNMPPYLAMTTCIAVQGIYPSRP